VTDDYRETLPAAVEVRRRSSARGAARLP